MDIIVSDFDNTLFRNKFGLIQSTVIYLESRELPVFIITYRPESQKDFMASVMAGTKIDVIGYGFADSRNKEYMRKITIAKEIQRKHNIIEALDDEENVVVAYMQHGIYGRKI